MTSFYMVLWGYSFLEPSHHAVQKPKRSPTKAIRKCLGHGSQRDPRQQAVSTARHVSGEEMSFCIISASSIEQAQLTMSRAETMCPFQALPKQQNHEPIKHCCCFKPLSFGVVCYSERNHLNIHLSIQCLQLLIKCEQQPGEYCQVLQVTSLPPFPPGSQPLKTWFQNPIFVSQAPRDCQTHCWFLCFFFQGAGGGGCSPDLGFFIFVYFSHLY